MFESRRQPYGLPVAVGEYAPTHPRTAPQGQFASYNNLPPEEEEGFDPLKLLWFAV